MEAGNLGNELLPSLWTVLANHSLRGAVEAVVCSQVGDLAAATYGWHLSDRWIVYGSDLLANAN